MNYAVLILTVALLANCGAQPAPEFFGAERFDVSRNGRDYTVFRKNHRFEVIRLGHARFGEHEAIRETMQEVVESTTNCKIKPATVQGDSGEMRGSLSCP